MGNLKRSEVPVNETWDLSLIYETVEKMEEDKNEMLAISSKIVEEYKGNLNNGKTINDCLDLYRQVMEILTKVSNYAELAVSVDYTDTAALQLQAKLENEVSTMMAELSFIDSEIIENSEDVLSEAVEMATANKNYIKDLLRQKPHRLNAETEKAFAALSSTFSLPYSVYNMSKLADISFDDFEVNGKVYPLSYSLFEDNYSYDTDTDVRRTAFDKFSQKISEYKNVTATAYNGQVTLDKTMSVLRGYESVFDYLLFNQKVTREMYDRQIDLIMERLAPHMRKYAKLKQKLHGLDKMTFADLKLPLDPKYVPSVTIPEAKDYCMKGLSPLGSEYVEMVEKAFDQRWIDFAQNIGKSTGGFCSSPYGKNSYILLSYNGKMSDVLTLAHELGHAGHFAACNSAQSIFDTDVSTYFVEAPSTINEIIMANYLLNNSTDKKFKRWVISSMVGNTYYHNFVTHLLEAAYQREVYKIIDEGGSVNATVLSEIKKSVLEKFWGDAVEINEGAELTWMRQPHYYMGLYSYTYSAGLTVGTQACLKMQQEGQVAVDRWKNVLKAGSTLDPIGLAKLADIDITTSEPLNNTIDYVGSLVDEIIKLTEEIEKEEGVK